MQTYQMIAKTAFGIGQDKDRVICYILDHLHHVILCLYLGEYPNCTDRMIADKVKEVIVSVAEVDHGKASRHAELLTYREFLKF